MKLISANEARKISKNIETELNNVSKEIIEAATHGRYVCVIDHELSRSALTRLESVGYKVWLCYMKNPKDGMYTMIEW